MELISFFPKMTKIYYVLVGNKFVNCDILPSRSSHPEVFCKKGVLRNFAKLTGKHLRQSLFFNKLAGQRETLVQVFNPCTQSAISFF